MRKKGKEKKREKNGDQRNKKEKRIKRKNDRQK